LAKHKYLVMTERDGKLRVDFRSWAIVIVVGLLLALLSIIDGGGLSQPAAAPAPSPACTFTANGNDVNVRTGATASSPSVQKLSQGQVVTGTKTVTNGYRQLADGTWVMDGLLTPVPGSVCT
jgi:hypothetical protein